MSQIDDVTHVIDSARCKEMGFDPHTKMSSLKEVFISRAAADQRAGRAGRVRAGKCYRLVSQDFLENTMHAYTLPEIRRVTLEDLVLTVLMLDLGQPHEFLSKAIQPPSAVAIGHAIQTLEEIEAIVINERDGHIILKPLGYHLASLPLDVRLGKMLIVASIFDCVEPMLAIAAALSGKSIFTSPLGKREESSKAKQRFAEAKSDHLALVEAWKAWCRVKDEPYPTRKDFCQQNYLSMSALEGMEAVSRQIRADLEACGFVLKDEDKKQSEVDHIDYTANAYDTALLKCILCSGLAPQVRFRYRLSIPRRPLHMLMSRTSPYIHLRT